jgi:hypothetical protein
MGLRFIALVLHMEALHVPDEASHLLWESEIPNSYKLIPCMVLFGME